MKERPILMSGEMVRAILEGRKTQTRRVVKPQPTCCSEVTSIEHHENPKCHNWLAKINGATLGIMQIGCKYGVPGDRLWVKERHAYVWGTYFPSGHKDVIYFADCVRDDSEERDGWWIAERFISNPLKWKPSIFMPRRASRITLEIVSVKVERLCDISEEDAKAEGVNGMFGKSAISDPAYRVDYRLLWEKINGAGSWEKNPWVWVVEFKRVAL